jgi:hypothetical protein
MKGTSLSLDPVDVPTFQQIIFETCALPDESHLPILAVYVYFENNLVLIGDTVMDYYGR